MLFNRDRIARGAILLVLVFMGASTGLAQQSVTFATLSGRVVDQNGAVIQNAQVATLQLETNTLSRTKTDSEGRFRFANLRLGKYEITVNQTGFANSKTTLTLTVGSACQV